MRKSVKLVNFSSSMHFSVQSSKETTKIDPENDSNDRKNSQNFETSSDLARSKTAKKPPKSTQKTIQMPRKTIEWPKMPEFRAQITRIWLRALRIKRVRRGARLLRLRKNNFFSFIFASLEVKSKR
ncbi:Protein CBG25438 [Caenorhabditis briggsae]|uniref:Protein CBG25438 n=1 Tax=Caenorhabditis briggsae TaxID=6238 RepID=B6ILD1_CAEBR|nr:Protein CBG25438 [Caenorhabditis briggsae]CAS00711.1 Protein CBG25438 [Caenorhabditis briggsae]